MPQATKSRSSSGRSAAFKEPAALKKLNQSLEAAQKALTELRQHAGGKSSKSLHAGVGKLVSGAKRDSGKLTTALKREFADAQKTAASAARTTRTTARKATTSAARTTRTTTRKATTAARTTRTTTRKATSRAGAKKTTKKAS